VYAMAFLLRYAELQAEQQTQSGKREQLLASLAVFLRDSSQQGSSPGAVARKAAAHQASAQAVLHKVENICRVFAWLHFWLCPAISASCSLFYHASCHLVQAASCHSAHAVLYAT